MRIVCLGVRALLAGSLALGAVTASPQNFPTKPIRIITSEPGGGLDFAARAISQGIAPALGHPVIVENRGGAGGLIAISTVAHAQPDGYTLLLYGSTIWLVPFMRDKVDYDPVRDFAPITLAVSSPNIVVVHPSVAATSVKELIALAKAKPGTLNYGSGASGASTHLSVELFKAMAGVDIMRIPYNGTGPALIGLISGQVQLMFATSGGVAPHLKTGRLRALAVTSPKPSALMPDLPPVGATVPGYSSASLVTIFAPARTPVPIVTRLNQEMVRFLRTSDAKDQFLRSGVEVVASSPAELAETMKAEMGRLGKVIKDAHIRDE